MTGPWRETRLGRMSSAQGSHEGLGTVKVPRENSLTWVRDLLPGHTLQGREIAPSAA